MEMLNRFEFHFRIINYNKQCISSSYLTLLRLKENKLSTKEVLALLNNPAMPERFNITLAALPLMRDSWQIQGFVSVN